MKTILLISSLLYCLYPVKNFWKILHHTEFTIYHSEEEGKAAFIPVSNPTLQALEGKTITFQGVPVSYDKEGINNSNTFVIMKKGWDNSCHVVFEEYGIKLHSKTPLKLKENKLYTFQGVFHFNTQNKLGFPFQIKEATCLDCN